MFALPSQFHHYLPRNSSSYPSSYFGPVPQRRRAPHYRPFTFVSEEEEDDDNYATYLAAAREEERQKRQREYEYKQALLLAAQQREREARADYERRARAYAAQQKRAEAEMLGISNEPRIFNPVSLNGFSVPSPPSTPQRPLRAQPKMSYESAVQVIQKHAKEQLAIRRRLSGIQSLRVRFQDLQKSVQFPSSLVFDIEKCTSWSIPILAYSAINRPLQTYEESLLRLLTDLDDIPSKGSKRVKEERKNLVLEIENELKRVDKVKLQEWERQKGSTSEVEEKEEEVVQAEQMVVEENAHIQEASSSSLNPADDVQLKVTTETEPEPVRVEEPQSSVPTEEPQGSTRPAAPTQNGQPFNPFLYLSGPFSQLAASHSPASYTTDDVLSIPLNVAGLARNAETEGYNW